MQSLDFIHHGFVYAQAARRVQNQHIKKLAFGVVQGGQGNVNRLLSDVGRKELGASLRADCFQLLDRRRAVHVG